MVYKAVGKSESEVDLEFMGSSRWDVGGYIAEKIGIGRVFLIGDSAHRQIGADMESTLALRMRRTLHGSWLAF